MAAETPSLDTIFCAAVEMPSADDRAAYIARTCGDDRELQARVEKLVDAHFRAGSFLEEPPPAPGATGSFVSPSPEPPALAEGPGAVIGPYKLLQQIGEGGMGTVFMAEQTQPVKRKVALKVIKPGMDSRQVIARFEQERQALAMMDHVNIARVLDAGTTDAGRPYFVMELVHGVPITKYCDDHQLTPRERLELFVPVCQAIQHAHQKGIIHRDVKPSNVMVTLYDGKPVPKVIDFGVAKATEQKLTERTLFTQYGTMVGTLEYMSPEQAEMSALGIDTRSDIYSLGVLLYELLTGSTPLTRKRFKDAAYGEILRIIKEEEPPKPSTRLSDSGEALASISAQRHMEPAKLAKLVRGELDWIVMKTLEKDRNRRYETANGFAADVQRYLNDESVQACPPSAGYRFRKFARRNRSGLAVTGLVLFFLVLLGSVAGWAWRDRAARAREADLEQVARAAEQANHLERAVERAELLQQQGKRGEALAAFERAQLLARESEPSPPLRKRIDSLQGLLDAEGQDLDFVARFEAIRREDQTEVDAEKNFFIVAKGYPKLRAALKEYGIEVAVTPPADAVARIQGRPPAVQKLVVTALDECLQFVPSKDAMSREWFLEVLEKADGDPWRREVRKAWRNVSELERLVKDVNVSRHPANFLVLAIGALPVTSPSRLDLARRVQRAYPDDFWANHRLGSDLNQSGKPLEAIHYHTAALALQPRNPGTYLNRSLAFEGSQNLAQALADINQAIDLAPRYAIAWRIKGRLLQRMKDLDNAEAALRQALVLDPKDSVARSLLIGQLKNAGRHRDAEVELRQAVALDPKDALAHYNLGNALRERRLDEAIASYRKAIEFDPMYAPAHNNLGNALKDQKKLDEAVACYKKAIEIDPKFSVAYNNLGEALRAQKKLPEAIVAYQKAIEIDPKHANAYNNLGNVLRDQKKLPEAIVCYKKAIELDPKVAWFHHNLGDALRDKGDVAGAIAALQKAIELDPKNAMAHNKVAWLLSTCVDAKLRNPAQAVALAKKAVELDPKNPFFPSTLAAAYYRSGEWKAAIAALEKSMELRKGGDSTEWFFLAMTHWRMGNKEEARKRYDQAVQWMDKNQPTDEELRRFRAEAAELLAVKEKKD